MGGRAWIGLPWRCGIGQRGVVIAKIAPTGCPPQTFVTATRLVQKAEAWSVFTKLLLKALAKLLHKSEVARQWIISMFQYFSIAWCPHCGMWLSAGEGYPVSYPLFSYTANFYLVSWPLFYRLSTTFLSKGEVRIWPSFLRLKYNIPSINR